MEYKHSQIVYQHEFLQELVQPGTRWLDIGCGNSIVPTWLRDSIPFQERLLARCTLACGCDPVDARPHVAGLQKYVGPCDRLPYPDASFNLVTANMVMEHVKDPALFAAEVNRVLVDGGRFVFHTPNRLSPLIFLASLLPKTIVRKIAHWVDERGDEEIFPATYRMNTKAALQHLAGFRVVELRYVGTAPLLTKIPLIRFIEKLLIRLSQRKPFRWLRTDLIGVMEKRQINQANTPGARALDWPESDPVGAVSATPPRTRRINRSHHPEPQTTI